MADYHHTSEFPSPKSFSFSFPALTSVLFFRACDLAWHPVPWLSSGRLSVESEPYRRLFWPVSRCAARCFFPDMRGVAGAGGWLLLSPLWLFAMRLQGRLLKR